MTHPRSHFKKNAKESLGEWLGGLLGDQAKFNTLPSSSGQAVTVNGVSIKLPKVYTGPGLSLHHAGLFLLLTTRLGLTLLWDGGKALSSSPEPTPGLGTGDCIPSDPSSWCLPSSEVKAEPCQPTGPISSWTARISAVSHTATSAQWPLLSHSL